MTSTTAFGLIYLHDYCTPGNYAPLVEAERTRVRTLTLHAREVAEKKATVDETLMHPDLQPTRNPQVFVSKPTKRMFSWDKFHIIGPPPPALKPCAMRKQVFVHNESGVWACTRTDLLRWLDEGYYVKCMRSIGNGRFYVCFADSWVDVQFVAEFKMLMYDH